MIRRNPLVAIVASSLLIVSGCGSGKAPAFPLENDGGAPAEQQIGERLFVDTRFAEYFAAHMTGVNDPLAVGDPVVAQVQTTSGSLPGPFAGESINCRSCHFVVEFQGVAGAGNRTYADFTDHSPLPLAMGSFTATPRNAMQMVGSLQSRSGPTFLQNSHAARPGRFRAVFPQRQQTQIPGRSPILRAQLDAGARRFVA